MTMYKMKCQGFVVEATQKKVQRYQHDSNVWVAAKHETHLDLSTFKHGNSWSTCYNT